MAVIRHTNFDKTVNTIADRDAITPRVDNMTVLVVDAIGDINAGPGTATYRWNEYLNIFVLMSKANEPTMSFDTLELVIDNTGSVVLPNVPQNNQIWDIQILNVNNVIAYPRIEDLTINAVSISGLNAWIGNTIRFTYAYGSITQQLTTYIDTVIGTLTDFEGAIA